MKKPLSVMQMVCISLVSILCCFYPDSLPDSSAAQSFAPGTQPKESYSNKKQFLNTVSGSYKDAETWFLNNVRDKGIFIYLYDPYTDSYADKNNMVRQLMSSRLLADLALDNPSLETYGLSLKTGTGKTMRGVAIYSTITNLNSVPTPWHCGHSHTAPFLKYIQFKQKKLPTVFCL
jgi:hypothetical protein